MKSKTRLSMMVMGITMALSAPGNAGITVYENGEKYVKVGGRIQLQYHAADETAGDNTDTLFFRRLRPYIEGSLHKDWKGKFQWDMGKATGDNEIAIKDAYMQYKVSDNMKIAFGNANFPFSREFLTTSKKQQLVERTFVGDHDYGTPDRNLGFHMTGHSSDKKLTYAASFASANIDPDENKLDFDTPVNDGTDFNQGWIVGGRVDFHPFGKLGFAQGDFKNKTLATISLAAYAWNNDGDNDTHTTGGVDDGTNKPDVDSVAGVEISGAFRTGGFSVDAEYNLFDAETLATNYTGGIFQNGSTELKNWSIEGGYMLIPAKLELVAGFQSQDADNYAAEWERISIGANWFMRKHDVKLQFSYRMGENINGVSGTDEDEVFIQAQYVF